MAVGCYEKTNLRLLNDDFTWGGDVINFGGEAQPVSSVTANATSINTNTSLWNLSNYCDTIAITTATDITNITNSVNTTIATTISTINTNDHFANHCFPRTATSPHKNSNLSWLNQFSTTELVRFFSNLFTITSIFISFIVHIWR